MALWRKRSFEHGWLPASGVLETGLVHAVAITPELDAGYLRVLDDDFLEVHHWPQSLLEHQKRGLRASRRIRHSLTKRTALLVLADDPTTVVGFVSVERFGIGNEPFQIGLQLIEDYRNRGFVSGLLPALADHLEDDGFANVALNTGQQNRAMIRICEKLGYSFNLVQHRHPDGEVETARQYTLLPR